MTISVLIGNSDDKLTQKEWSEFVKMTKEAIIDSHSFSIHFCGGSASDSPFQNYCWVFELLNEDGCLESVRASLKAIRKMFKQDSAAIIVGETEFI